MSVDRRLVVIVLLAFAAACETNPAENSGFLAPFTSPSFSVLPGGLDALGCGQLEAWAYSAHFASPSTVTFMSPVTGYPRAQCGDLGFNELGVADVYLRYTPVTGRYEKWLRSKRHQFSVPLDENTVSHSIPSHTTP
jgi:hypothetical protein